MKYRTIIHCCNPNLVKPTIQLARKNHLSVKICKYNPYGIIIKGTKKSHNAFCALLEDQSDYGIFYDHKHPKSAFYTFKPHYRLGNDVDINKLSAEPSIIPMGEYGRTPEWYRQMYHIKTNSEASPTIAVISLNNNYNPEDLRNYWTHVCGLSELPTVVDILVGHKIKQRNTGFGVAYHNTLQLEILGALCPKATLLFISAPNTITGLYQAISTAIYGNKSYQANFILCTWGTSELSLKSSILNAFNNLFERAYQKNITIIASAGDNGYDDKNVNFPASSPYVLSIGGSTLFPNGTETLWDWNPIFRWGTRTGVSAYFPKSVWNLNHNNDNTRRVPDLILNANPNYGYTTLVDHKILLNGIGGTTGSASLCTAFLASMGLPIKEALTFLSN
jgi:kumamolisin